ncbi:MAG: outer membrane beta-barrel protein [Bdellovibrionota bacterium]
MSGRRNSKPPAFVPALGWCTLLVLLLGTPQARSESQGLHFNVSLSTNVTDNVNNAPTGEKSDFFFVYEPEIEWGRRLAAGSFSVSGGVTGYVYAKEDRLSRVYADVNTSLELQATNRLSLTLSDRFVPTPLQYSNTDGEPTNLIQANTANAVLLYDIPLPGYWTAHLQPGAERYDVIDWHDDIASPQEPDRTDVFVSGNFMKKVGRLAELTLESNYRTTFFDNTSPELIDHSTLGTSLDLSLRTKKWRYSLSGGLARFFKAGGDDTTWILKTSIHWLPSSRTDIGVDAERNYSTQVNGRFFRVNSVKFGMLHKLFRRLEISVDLLLVALDDEGLGAQDDTALLSISPTATYLLGKHFKIGVQYEHARRKSPNNAIEFTRNVGSLTLGATF